MIDNRTRRDLHDSLREYFALHNEDRADVDQMAKELYLLMRRRADTRAKVKQSTKEGG